MHPNPVLIAAWMDADEHYHARIYMSSGTAPVASSSLGLMAYAAAETVTQHSVARGLDEPDIEWLWLGLIADDSRDHLAVAIVEEQQKARNRKAA